MWTWERPRPVDQLVTPTCVKDGQPQSMLDESCNTATTKYASKKPCNTGNHGTSVRTLTLTVTSVHLSSNIYVDAYRPPQAAPLVLVGSTPQG